MEMIRRDWVGFSVSLLSIAVVLGFFSAIFFEILSQGAHVVSFDFIFGAPDETGVSGGIFPVLVSTGLILCVCFAVVIPFGTITAYFLHEIFSSARGLGRLLSMALDLLSGMPSIVFGLFGMFFFGEVLGFGYSILNGGLTLALMVLPYFTRCVEDGMNLVPREYRMGAKALALSRMSAFRHVIFPSTLPSLVLGFVLGVSRALAETAALLFTSGYVLRPPESLFDSGKLVHSVHFRQKW